MGVVLLAERADHAFDQRVAIKLLRSGLVSARLQSRLKMERQILAALDHPNIAKLLDGGATTDGTPYIVMEYIDGEPIDTYCDAHRFTVSQRLELFRIVCAAVHYAHQNLIVHRDLKPSNILVTADGVPKLLDFGIAKVLDSRQLHHTLALTQADVRLMTPDHASPEQLRGDAVSTASDIYLLGVLLYELLSGHRPIAVHGHSLAELERAICEQAPMPLTAGLQSQDFEAVQEVCAQRSTAPARLRRELAGDLNNIVMMALRKEPARRYSSAEQFSTDISRYLSGRPVAARPDTWTYRARKFVARYRYGVAVATLAVLALVLFTTSTVEQNRRISRERLRAEQVSSFLVELFEQADPTHSRGNEVTARELLDIGARRIQSDLDTQPDVRASLLATIGTVYGSLGFYPDAIQLLDRSLQQRLRLFGPQSLEVANSMQLLGRMLASSGELARADTFLVQALDIDTRLAADDRLKIASALHDLANLRRMQERFEEADSRYRDVLRMLSETNGEEGALLVETLTDRGQLLAYLGRQDEALQSFSRARDIATRTLGSTHPDTAHVIQNLADSLARQGRLAEADPLFKESLTLYRTLFGEEHPYTMMALANYGRFLQQSGKSAEAEKVLRETLSLNIRVRGPDHVFVGYSHMLLGLTLLDQNDCSRATTEEREALSIYRKSLPDDHLYVGSARFALGRALAECGQAVEGEKEIRASLHAFQNAPGIEPSMIGLIHGAIGRAVYLQGRYDESEPLLREGYLAALHSRGTQDASTKRARAWISDLYATLGKPQAEKDFIGSASR
jgi:serine/threonine-protein kinase